MVFNLLALFTTLSLSFYSQAAVKVTNLNSNTYSHATGVLFGEANNSTTNTVYGGYAGDCSGSTSATCDSCAELTVGTLNQSCNTKRIHDDLNLQVVVHYDAENKVENTGEMIVTTDFETTNGQQQIVLANSTGDITGGSTVTLDIPWSNICTVLFASTDSCKSTATFGTTGVQSIRIGIDKNDDDRLDGTDDDFTSNLRISLATLSSGQTSICTSASTGVKGACNFMAYPGDGKVYIENVRADCSFPSLDGSTEEITSVRVYYNKLTDGVPNQLSGSAADLQVSGDNLDCSGETRIIGLANNEVSGLTNTEEYIFSIGVVDLAGNVGLVTTNTSTTNTDVSECFDTTGAESQNRNCHIATPSEVAGLITDEFDCFITTATYGSPFRPKVQTFRLFRNKYLKTNSIGRFIIYTYYTYSPPIAKWIHNHPKSRTYVRMALWPLWFFAKVCLEFPLVILLLSFSFLTLFIYRKKLKEVIL